MAKGADPAEVDQAVDPTLVTASIVSTDLPTAVPEHGSIPPSGHSHLPKSAPEDDSTLRAGDPVDPDHLVHDLRPRNKAGFTHLYGWMGVPMVVIFVMSAVWTIMLAVIQQAPTWVANYLMDTEDLDFGDFWLLPKPGPELSVSATILLVLFGIGYLSLAVLMVFPDKLMPMLWNARGPAHVEPVHKTTDTDTAAQTGGSGLEPKVMPVENLCSDERAKKVQTSTLRPTGWSWERVKYEALSADGLVHQYYNPILDLPKLIFQTTTLFTYLHNGFPVVVVYIYTCALFVNWLISSYRYRRERPDPHFIAARIFYSFDLFFAVFAPLEVLCYAYYTFKFDRDVFATRAATLGPGSFDRTARLFADPTEVSLFRIAFHYLQFTTTGSLLVKCALNTLSIFKWWRTIIHLVEHARTAPAVRNSMHLGSFERKSLAKIRKQKQLQNVLIACLFFCAGAAVFIQSIVAVESSKDACKAHPQCKVPSYQWNVGAKYCSCIVFVDRETELTTMADWEDPPDTFENLAALAATGHLRIVQIINRQLTTLPDELRRCHHLEQLILLYTKTLTIPDWANEFSYLEYLHIEGDLTAKQLTYLPRNLFANTPHLLFLHLGSLVKLPSAPDLDHLPHLQYLSLAMLHSVTALPSLTGLHSLQRLKIIDAIQLYTLPSTSELTHLKTFALTSRNPVCCNGFITGTCNLTEFSCLNRTAIGEPLVQCTTERIGAEDYKQLMETDGIVCEKDLKFDLKNVKPTLASTDLACGGVKYKKCIVNGAAGMCYPARMQPISCQLNTGYQMMRRLQIERGVGERCNATVEGWLGCQAS